MRSRFRCTTSRGGENSTGIMGIFAPALTKFEADPEWERRFNEYLRSNNRALDSFRSWVDAGIPQDWLLQMLHQYTSNDVRRQQQLHYRTMALLSLEEIDRVLKAMNKASDALEHFNGNEGIPDWIKDNHFNLRRNLSTLLAKSHGAMEELRRELAKFASEKGEGVGEELLVGLVEAVRDVTGQPNWGDLAYLVEGAYFAHKRDRSEVDREKIRKRYVRFVKNFPRIYESWMYLDWKCFFGLEQKTEALSDLSPQGAMGRFMQRFGDKEEKTRSTKPRYGKIHTSMKR